MSYMCPNEHISEGTCTPEGNISIERSTSHESILHPPFPPADVELRKACKKGEYNLQVIATATEAMYFTCKQCDAGYYQDDDEFLGLECSPCPGGTYVNFKGAIAVDRCQPVEQTGFTSRSCSSILLLTLNVSALGTVPAPSDLLIA